MWKHQGLKLVLLLLGLMLLVACFDDEPEERKKFISFLNSHYLDQAGIGVADLTGDDLVSQDIGRYFKHHQEVFSYYQDEAERLLEPNMKSIQARMPLSYDNIPETVAALGKSKEDVARLLTDSESIYKKTLDRKNQLKMSDEVKVVFDRAFEKTITASYEAAKTIFGEPIVELIDARIKLLQYVEAHRSEIKTSGTRLEISDPALLHELKPLLDEANAKAKAWEKIRNEVKADIRGR